jgi:hypothetical protein
MEPLWSQGLRKLERCTPLMLAQRRLERMFQPWELCMLVPHTTLLERRKFP